MTKVDIEEDFTIINNKKGGNSKKKVENKSKKKNKEIYNSKFIRIQENKKKNKK